MEVAMNPTTDKDREWKWEVDRAVGTLTEAKEIRKNAKLMKAVRQRMKAKAKAMNEALADAGGNGVGRALMNMK